MKHRSASLVILGAILVACGAKSEDSPPARAAESWSSSPDRVVEGLMHAYAARDDSLYATLLADDFRYYFEPPEGQSGDALGWGREEDIVSTGNLFKTPEVTALRLSLQVAPAHPVEGKPGWMVVPVAGGELRVDVKDKEPMQQTLNRQEIYLKPHPRDPKLWQIVEWKDFPAP